jgi:hypothetical protein
MNPGISEKQPLHVVMVSHQTFKSCYWFVVDSLGARFIGFHDFHCFIRLTPKQLVDQHGLLKRSSQLSCLQLLLESCGMLKPFMISAC